MKSLTRTLVALSGLAVSTQAHAISCAEIVKMVNVSVPTSIVAQTMEASGTKFTAADVQCLSEQGAPPELVDLARRMAQASEPVAAEPVRTAPVRTEPQEDPDALDRAQAFTGDIETDTAEGSEEGDTSGPPRIEELVKLYRANKVLTASKGFYDLLESNEYPEYESKIHYYLGKALYDLGMYHGAQHHFMEVVRKGPSNPYFKYALPKMVGIARITGNDIELLRIVDKIDPEAYPRQAKNYLFYLMGRTLYKNGDLASASKFFQQVSSKSDLYLRSKYFEGIIQNDGQRLKSAVKAFRDVYQSDIAPADEREAAEFNDLQDLALLNIARVYYGLERFDDAGNWFDMVDRDSSYWAESLFEHAWGEFMVNDLNHSLGLLLTSRSPYFAEHEYTPEATVLRALNYFNLCEFNDAEQTLLSFEGTYQPQLTEIKAFLSQYQSAEGRQLADQAYEAYFEKPHRGSHLDKALFTRVLRSRDLAALIRHMDMMDSELQLVDAQKGVWQQGVGEHIKKVIAQDRLRYKKAAGQLLLSELAYQAQVLTDLMSQSKIIRFEVVDAQREDYMYKASAPQVETLQEKKVDFATSKDIIYWPFNGEFWKDELGYYRYAEQNQCK